MRQSRDHLPRVAPLPVAHVHPPHLVEHVLARGEATPPQRASHHVDMLADHRRRDVVVGARQHARQRAPACRVHSRWPRQPHRAIRAERHLSRGGEGGDG